MSLTSSMTSPVLTSHISLRWLAVTSLLLTLVALRSRGDDVFASSEHMKVLARGERDLDRALEVYIEAEQERVYTLQRLLAEVRSQDPDRGQLDPPSLVGNPLKALGLIERFVGTWQTALSQILTNFNAWQALQAVLEPLRPYLPSGADREGALHALGRLQETYSLPLDELLAGTVGGVPSTPPLSQRTATEIGNVMLEAHTRNGSAASEAIYRESAARWYRAALNHSVEPLSAPQSIYHGLARALALGGDHLAALQYLQKAVELDPTNPQYLRDILPSTGFQEQSIVDWMLKYKTLCQQAAFNTHPANASSSLRCAYHRTALRPYAGYKTELLHHSPDVLLFHDIITDNEATTLRGIANENIQRAMVGAGTGTVSNVRVGKIAWLYDETPNATVAHVSRRVSDATGLDTTFPRSEPLQMSNYGLGGHYEPHYDLDENRYVVGNVNTLADESGDRIATFMLYMNEVLLGGATVFPLLDLAIKPVKNAAVFWYNYRRSGAMETKSLHAACPVILGEKWVANKWIHEFGQEFRRPCLLDPTL